MLFTPAPPMIFPVLKCYLSFLCFQSESPSRKRRKLSSTVELDLAAGVRTPSPAPPVPQWEAQSEPVAVTTRAGVARRRQPSQQRRLSADRANTPRARRRSVHQSLPQCWLNVGPAW